MPRKKKPPSEKDVARVRAEQELEEQKTAAVVAAAMSAPGMDVTLQEIATESGLSPGVVRAIFEKLRTKGLALGRALGEVTREETQRLWDHQAHRILASVTDDDIRGASLYQKITSAAIATDKGLLLAGQPTQILSMKQLENLDELAGLLVGEIARRGLTVHDVEQIDVASEPLEPSAQVVIGDEPGTPGRWKTPNALPAVRRAAARDIEDPKPHGPLP